MNLTRASKELFRRTPDECFPSLDVLIQHCQWQREQSQEIWQPPKEIGTQAIGLDRLMLSAGDGQTYQMNDWSFQPALPVGRSVEGDRESAFPRHRRPRLLGKPCREAISRCNCSRRASNSARSMRPATRG